MNVGELIAALEQMPRELTVFRSDSSYADNPVVEVRDEDNYSGARVVTVY